MMLLGPMGLPMRLRRIWQWIINYRLQRVINRIMIDTLVIWREESMPKLWNVLITWLIKYKIMNSSRCTEFRVWQRQAKLQTLLLCLRQYRWPIQATLIFGISKALYNSTEEMEQEPKNISPKEWDLTQTTINADWHWTKLKNANSLNNKETS